MTELVQPPIAPLQSTIIADEKATSIGDSRDGKEANVNISEKARSDCGEVEYQWGVQKARAITTVWDNKSKWTLFVM
jgi:hypothetical protein